MVWNKKYSSNINLKIDEIIERVDNAIKEERYNNILLIFNRRVENAETFFEKYELITYFNDTIVANESFYIYQLKTGK